MPAIARRLWVLFEPYHALVYFAPETLPEYAAAGLKGGWMGYFASRSAAMGPVGPGVVTAVFYNFAPSMVRRALPDAWTFSTPERVLAARHTVVDAALTRVLGEDRHGADVAAAAEIALAAVAAADASGRPLFAAHADLEPPDEPHLRLWHALTCLREHRGDGHVAALLNGELDGCEANVLAVAAGLVPAAEQRARRGWTEEEWADAGRRLADRGLLDADGVVTDGGLRARDAVEVQTDALAAQPYAALGEAAAVRLATALEPLARRVADGGAFPYPNPVGVPRPT